MAQVVSSFWMAMGIRQAGGDDDAGFEAEEFGFAERQAEGFGGEQGVPWVFLAKGDEFRLVTVRGLQQRVGHGGAEEPAQAVADGGGVFVEGEGIAARAKLVNENGQAGDRRVIEQGDELVEVGGGRGVAGDGIADENDVGGEAGFFAGGEVGVEALGSGGQDEAGRCLADFFGNGRHDRRWKNRGVAGGQREQQPLERRQEFRDAVFAHGIAELRGLAVCGARAENAVGEGEGDGHAGGVAGEAREFTAVAVLPAGFVFPGGNEHVGGQGHGGGAERGVGKVTLRGGGGGG